MGEGIQGVKRMWEFEQATCERFQWYITVPASLYPYREESSERKRPAKSHYCAIATLGWRSVRVFAFADRTPYWGNLGKRLGYQVEERRKEAYEVILRRFTVPNQTEQKMVRHKSWRRIINDIPWTSLAYFDSRSCQILFQPLVMLYQSTKLQLRHGLLERNN